MSNAQLTTTNRTASGGRDDSLTIAAAKFLLPSAAATAVWLTTLVFLNPATAGPSFSGGSPNSVGDMLGLVLLVGVVGSVLAALAVHRAAPREYTDRFHLLGVHLSMFVAINATITALCLAVWALAHAMGAEAWGPETLSAYHAIAMVILSSVFLPGPYAGALIGHYWSD